jgi:DNA-binding response OmpR family regulator
MERKIFFRDLRDANRGKLKALSAIDSAEKTLDLAGVIDPLAPKVIDDTSRIYVHSGFTYCSKSNLIRRNGTDTYLTEKENNLLKLLINSPDRIIPNREIKRNVWGLPDGDNCKDDSVRVLVCKLRAKLGQTSSRGESEIIHGVSRVGYGLVGQVRSQDS